MISYIYAWKYFSRFIVLFAYSNHCNFRCSLLCLSFHFAWIASLLTMRFPRHEKLDIPSRVKVPVDKLKRFILVVRSCMFDNPYHNWFHAIDVTQVLILYSARSPYFALFSQLRIMSRVHAGISPVWVLQAAPKSPCAGAGAGAGGARAPLLEITAASGAPGRRCTASPSPWA